MPGNAWERVATEVVASAAPDAKDSGFRPPAMRREMQRSRHLAAFCNSLSPAALWFALVAGQKGSVCAQAICGRRDRGQSAKEIHVRTVEEHRRRAPPPPADPVHLR